MFLSSFILVNLPFDLAAIIKYELSLPAHSTPALQLSGQLTTCQSLHTSKLTHMPKLHIPILSKLNLFPSIDPGLIISLANLISPFFKKVTYSGPSSMNCWKKSSELCISMGPNTPSPGKALVQTSIHALIAEEQASRDPKKSEKMRDVWFESPFSGHPITWSVLINEFPSLQISINWSNLQHHCAGGHWLYQIGNFSRELLWNFLDLWEFTTPGLDNIADATLPPPDGSFIKTVFANAEWVLGANTTHKFIKEITNLVLPKGKIFCPKGVDLANLIFIRSLAVFNPFSPKMKNEDLQACDTPLQARLVLTTDSWIHQRYICEAD